MDLKQALEIAEKCKAVLAPACQRIEIAGSIRRKKPAVKDIELVCIPKMGYKSRTSGLFADDIDLSWPCRQFEECIGLLGHKIKGRFYGRYLQRELNYGVLKTDVINLDIFVCTPINWGFIFAIRTGPAEFSKYLMAFGKYKSLRFENGNVYRLGSPENLISVPDEADFFKLLEYDCPDPEKRNADDIIANINLANGSFTNYYVPPYK